MVRISKILEGIIAQVAFDTTRMGIDSNFKDHLALALLRSEGSMVHRVLSSRLADWQIYQLGIRIENELKTAIHTHDGGAEEFFRSYTTLLKQRYAESTKSISTLHALCDILSDRLTLSARAFERYGIYAQDIITQADSDNYQSELQNDDSQPNSQLLDVENFGVDMTLLAEQGKIDPVLCRDSEIERVIQILSRRKKNNPVLIGEAGVGKSAIIEGLALKIVQGDVPDALINKRLISLDISSLIAGTRYRGEFEERIQQLLSTLITTGDTILFIDEIHTIVGAGATQGALDTANILKPALARGELKVIGATTPSEYHQSIERDSALERRFQPLQIEPTTAEQTKLILKQIAPIYQLHHNVIYTADAIEACVELSGRYISERQFPDKAIDLLDEAGARVHLAATTVRTRALAEAITTATTQKSSAIKDGRYNKAIEARIEEIALRHQAHKRANTPPAVVDREDIARTVTAITGIPTEKISASESRHLQQLESLLSKRIIGQAEAVATIASAIRRARTGLKDEHRPCGVFMFVGATGVGKTLLAKELSQWYSGNNNALIRLDMSEYSQPHTVSRLFGAPPGYVGYGQGGELTEAVRRRPYSVVLFDEIEKAHPTLFNTLLQVLDEGYITDSEGRKVDFKSTIIIMTSNVGSATNIRQREIGYITNPADKTPMTESFHRALERHFAPEFLNRIDEIVLFNELSTAEAQQIVNLELNAIISRLKKLGYNLHITPQAQEYIVKNGFDKKYGARSIKRTITRLIEHPISQMIVDNSISKHLNITISCKDNRLSISQ